MAINTQPPQKIQRIAVFGANGMLGTDLCQVLRQHGYQVIPYDLPQFDITDSRDLVRAFIDADATINCAAYTNVDAAESDRQRAYAVNAAAIAGLAELASQYERYILHISTDFVFDGKLPRPYRETDTPCPLSVYGVSKLDGERYLQHSGCRHAIVRVQWTYGSHGANFISKLIARARSQPELAMVNDQIGSPTATIDVANAICELIGKQPQGLFHYAADGYGTRYEVAEAVLQMLGIDCQLRACTTADFPAAAQRPLNSRFDCSCIDALLSQPRPHWRASLQRFCQSLLAESG